MSDIPPMQTQTMVQQQYPPMYMTNLQVIPDREQNLVHIATRHPQFPFTAVSALTVKEATQLMLHLRLALKELDTQTVCQRVSSPEKANNDDPKK